MRIEHRVQLIAAILFVTTLLGSPMIQTEAQGTGTLKYGDKTKGEILSAKDKQLQLVYFKGHADDLITITVKRASGNLSPLLSLGYFNENNKAVLVKNGLLSADGKTVEIKDFTLKADHTYYILTGRQGLDKGKTTGKYTLTLDGIANGESPCIAAAALADSIQPPSKSKQKQWAKPLVVIDTTHSYCAFLTTKSGLIVLELFPEAAPWNVNSFVFLAQNGFYDNITWHRVIAKFVAQTGDPTGKGTGGPGYTTILEINPDIIYDREGRVGVARAQDKDSAGSQFFITLAPTPGLDPHSEALPDNEGYSIIGQVVDGMDVVKRIAPRDPEKSQKKGDALLSVRVLDLSTAQDNP
jgi:peptidylprolyl isomerase